MGSLEEDEAEARQAAHHNQLWLLILNTYTALFVFLRYLISIEGILGIALSVGATLYVYFEHGNDFDGTVQSWILLTFATITPINALVRMAFSRREAANNLIAHVLATMSQLYSAHSLWNWGKGGRNAAAIDWVEHSEAVFQQILAVCDKLARILELPNSNRARHNIVKGSIREAEHTKAVSKQFKLAIVIHLAKLSELCEVLKEQGLPPNEATRIRQWERMVAESIEKLRFIKEYRTPQGLRSFARLFSIFLPPLYAPFYASLARELNSLGTAITFAILTSVALTALFETVTQLEDPFVTTSFLDGIQVRKELVDGFRPELETLQCHFFPDADRLERNGSNQP